MLHPTGRPARDALFNIGITVDRNTVKRILNDHGIEPAPERRSHTPWKTFLDAHWDALAALDFFTVEVLTLAGIIRYHVLFVIRLKTREVQIVGITAQPCEEWMKQPARNLTDTFDGFLRDACCTTPDISSWTGTRCTRHVLGGCLRITVQIRSDYLRGVQI